jgi:predicted dehydrogenase
MGKTRFGIIGSGKIVELFLEAASEVDEFSFHAFYSRNMEKAKEFQKQYNVPFIYADLDEMLGNDEIDAVYIAVPNFLHYEYTMMALKQGKHVLVEKPFSSNAEEARRMIKLAKEKNRLLMEAMRVTMLPNFNRVKENLHKIGKVRRYSSSFCQYSSRYDSFLKGDIMNTFKKELSNGALMDIGVYCIAPMVNLFGMPNDALAVGTKLHNGVDGQGQALFSYDDMEGHVQYSKISTSYLPTEIQGESGTMVIDRMPFYDKVMIRYKDGTVEDLGIRQEDNDMVYEIREFISKIENKETESEINSLKISLEVMEVLDMLRRKSDIVFPSDGVDV